MQKHSRITGRSLVAFVLLNCVLNCATEAKPANLSTSTNYWQLPEEGSGVFYRFFRDKISWFEADAVCQFHHGNLVTVNNGNEFDATRAFLRELDVLDTVWIGLRGSSGSSQFFWANSQPLDFNAGYWAESFPATENPLCAAIDPTRSFRWHALNCNGPATAAFLCELPVPDWGAQCTVTAMPSVTIQYLSDSAAIRLSRDCGDEEGERHVLCTAGADRTTILSQLVCNNNENHNSSPSSPTSPEALEAIASAEPPLTPTVIDSTTTTTTPLMTTESSVASAINKIVTEFQSIATNDSLNAELQPMKPRKQLPKTKKYIPVEKKFKRIQLEKEQRGITTATMDVAKASASDQKEEETEEKELLTGVTATDESEHLPRIKKMRAEDLKQPAVSQESTAREERVRRETQNVPISTAGASEIIFSTTVSIPLVTEQADEQEDLMNSTGTLFLSNNSTEGELGSGGYWPSYNGQNWTGNIDEDAENTPSSSSPAPLIVTTESDNNVERLGTPHSAQPKGAITHPMHISSDMTKELNEIVEGKVHKSNKRILADHQDHFVPPMLMVKTKFVPGKQHIDAQEDLTTFDGNFSAPINFTTSSQVEASNDISKFYPASTEKPSLMEVEQVLVKIAAESSIDVTSVKTTVEEVSSSAADSTSHSSSSAVPEIGTETDSSANTPSTHPSGVTTSTASGATEVAETTVAVVADAAAKEPNYHSEFSFSNVENYKPYRPNRRRMLTKPRSHSYLRKILG